MDTIVYNETHGRAGSRKTVNERKQTSKPILGLEAVVRNIEKQPQHLDDPAAWFF